MKSLNEKSVLASGASIAGLSTAYWMNRLGYRVTVIEQAAQPRTFGAAIDVRGETVAVVQRMGIYEELKARRLHVESVAFKNVDDVTEGTMPTGAEGGAPPDDELEIERDQFIPILRTQLKDEVEFIFSDSITALNETAACMEVSFRNSPQRAFDLVLGCDGTHSVVRKLWFGHETEYRHFLQAYFSVTIVPKLLIPEKSMQLFNVPDKAIMLNAYNNKTDIIFCFFAEEELRYDYRDIAQQRTMLQEQFEGVGWRAPALLDEIAQSNNFYFDQFCQIKMPSWTKGRVALVGDAGYSASPAAGMGASLSISGAAALADALEKHHGDFEPAFLEYNHNLRPFIEEVQAMAERNIREGFIPRTEEAIRKRNTQGF